MKYGFYSDDKYPSGIGVKINGSDVTDQLGGPWGSATGTVEVDNLAITDILNGPGQDAVKRKHTVEFYCTTGRGIIYAEVEMLKSIVGSILS
jgi:hypothetical protein